MVSAVPNPQVLATCSMAAWGALQETTGCLKADRVHVVGRRDPHLRLAHPAEVPFGQVLDGFGVGVLGGEQGRELGLASGAT
jgi:hypothetical protein